MPGGSRRSADSPLAVLIAAGWTLEAAARTAGVSHRTATRRMREPAFQVAIHTARARLIDQTVGLLASATAEASLVTQLALRDAAPVIHLRAAALVLAEARQYQALGDVDARLRAIKEQLALDAAAADPGVETEP